jgi:hypothetical protein
MQDDDVECSRPGRFLLRRRLEGDDRGHDEGLSW